jgi:methyl-accepting chemotaxis protein
MEDIVNSIRGVTVIMSEISTASIEQTLGIEQVNQAISEMDDVTQQNAALVEQAAASAESLEEQAQNMAITVSGFKLDDKLGSKNANSSRKDHAVFYSNLLNKKELEETAEVC